MISRFEKWRGYFTLCRQKASEFGVSMRMLDQAL